MSTNFEIDITSLGLEKNYLYEVLATTFSFDNNLMVPNTASMGVRLVDKKTLKILPYPNTTTYKNIEKYKIVVLNFVEDVFLYALASLKDFGRSNRSNVISKNYYSHFLHKDFEEYKHSKTEDSVQIPYLKQSWAIIVCQATTINQIVKNDEYGKSKLMEVDLTAISFEKFKESFKLYNRAENLTLETIVLSTKFKAAIKNNNKDLIKTIKNKIEENINHIKRIGKNLSALKAIEHIEGYIKGLEP